MSYLTLPDGIDNFGQVVISFWFRVPGSTLAATEAAYVGGGPNPPFNGITPLIVFGNDSVNGYNQTQPLRSSIPRTLQQWGLCNPTFPSNVGPKTFLKQSDSFVTSMNSFGLELDTSSPTPKEPCYIGIDCNIDQTLWGEDEGETTKPNVLRINLQFSGIGSGAGMGWETSVTGSTFTASLGSAPGSTPDASGNVVMMAYSYPPPPGSQEVIGDSNPETTNIAYSDASDVAFTAFTEQCVVKPDIEVTPNRWHHILLACDMTGSISAAGQQYAGYEAGGVMPIPPSGTGSITTACQIWLAYDDENISGARLLGGSFSSERTAPVGDNDLFTQSAANTAWQINDVDHTAGPRVGNFGGAYISVSTFSGLAAPSYHYTPDQVESTGFPIGIPATPKYVDNIRHVEMAEFQMWTGTTIDTSEESYRRLFVDHDGKPVDPSEAAHVLGEPILKLHTSKKWIVGTNDGSLGGDLESPSGDFTPTGVIKAYKPDPSLHGAQGKPQLAQRKR